MRQKRSRRPERSSGSGRPPIPSGPSDVEHAWRALTVALEMVKHAETKAAATLAAAGVLGGVLYTFAQRLDRPGPALVVAVTGAAVLLVCAVLGAGLALRPRAGPRGGPVSLLYHQSVADLYRRGPDEYVDALRGLVRDPDALIRAVATQVWVNAHVASAKYRWGNLGVFGLLGGTCLLAVAAAVARHASG
ncbi:Pycsar system effector family protein [Micromonospora sp. AKA38]|uniref:Pycsar system effector family protein n=1 Tax=Micromonospora sp. AKA38 TaxID=2733861 RepID=UPI00248FB82A|nr:Pycsar system effector family protein [Micromonospora sp. AKA38]